MGMTTHALAVLQQLYSPNILVLVSRLLVQAQIGAAPFVHPTRSLLALFFMLVLTNFSAVFLHCLDFWAGLNGGKGVVLDFVGQCEFLIRRRGRTGGVGASTSSQQWEESGHLVDNDATAQR